MKKIGKIVAGSMCAVVTPCTVPVSQPEMCAAGSCPLLCGTVHHGWNTPRRSRLMNPIGNGGKRQMMIMMVVVLVHRLSRYRYTVRNKTGVIIIIGANLVGSRSCQLL